MTNEQIDREIALKVMGWTHYTTPGHASGLLVPTDYWSNGTDKRLLLVPEWRPSEKIADAWKVLEKFEQRDDVFLRTEPDGWSCLICADNNKDYEGRAKSAPLAISLACLKAVGVDVEAWVSQ